MMAAASLVISACSSDTPTAPSASQDRLELTRRAPRMTGWTLPASGAIEGGGSFTGTVTVKRFDVNEARELVVTGTLSGTVTRPDGTQEAVTQSFVGDATLTKSAGATAGAAPSDMTSAPGVGGSCDILFLDLGPLHLDILGLTVDLSRIVLDINAVAGGGNLLGNLLCAVVGLFDGIAFLAAIQNLLDLINSIIGGL
jgi:hypothetical protein